jgi:hypothetical protein
MFDPSKPWLKINEEHQKRIADFKAAAERDRKKEAEEAALPLKEPLLKEAPSESTIPQAAEAAAKAQKDKCCVIS